MSASDWWRRVRQIERGVALILALCAGGTALADKPSRIVSLNLCADQLVVLLVPPHRIASVTYLARDREISHVWRRAESLQINYGRAEEVIAQEPDLVVTGKTTTRPAAALLTRLGFNVVELDIARDIAGVRAQLRQVAQAVGEVELGESLIATMDRRIEAIRSTAPLVRPLAAIYRLTSGTAGRGTLMDEILGAAGYENLARRLGLDGQAHLPLETLIVNQPEFLIIDAPYADTPTLTHQLIRHPALAASPSPPEFLDVASRDWVCGGPFIAETVERLAAARR